MFEQVYNIVWSRQTRCGETQYCTLYFYDDKITTKHIYDNIVYVHDIFQAVFRVNRSVDTLCKQKLSN